MIKPSVFSVAICKGLLLPEVVTWRCSINAVFSKCSWNWQENICFVVYFLNKVTGLKQKQSTRALNISRIYGIWPEFFWAAEPVFLSFANDYFWENFILRKNTYSFFVIIYWNTKAIFAEMLNIIAFFTW